MYRIVSLFALVSLAAVLCASDAAAQWCARYRGGGTNCGFQTLSQCQATISGMAGICSQDTSAPAAGASSEPKRRKTKKAKSPKRQRAAPPSRPAPKSAAKPAPAKVSPPAKPADPYQAARQLVLDGRYRDGIAALQALGYEDHPDVATYLGLANRGLGRVEAARGWYAKALAANPDHLLALMHDGMLRGELGDTAGARSRLARIKAVCRGDCPEYTQLEKALAAASK